MLTTDDLPLVNDEDTKFFYLKRFRLVEHEKLGFLQGKWLESKECDREQLMDEFPLTLEFLNELDHTFEAPTMSGELIKIIPLKHVRVIK